MDFSTLLPYRIGNSALGVVVQAQRLPPSNCGRLMPEARAGSGDELASAIFPGISPQKHGLVVPSRCVGTCEAFRVPGPGSRRGH